MIRRQKAIEDAMMDMLGAYQRLDEAVLLQDRPKVQAALLRAVAGTLASTAGLLRDEACSMEHLALAAHGD